MIERETIAVNAVQEFNALCSSEEIRLTQEEIWDVVSIFVADFPGDARPGDAVLALEYWLSKPTVSRAVAATRLEQAYADLHKCLGSIDSQSMVVRHQGAFLAVCAIYYLLSAALQPDHGRRPELLEAAVRNAQNAREASAEERTLTVAQRDVLAACKAAEQVISFFTRYDPDDPRPAMALAIARRWLVGAADASDCRAAYEDLDLARRAIPGDHSAYPSPDPIYAAPYYAASSIAVVFHIIEHEGDSNTQDYLNEVVRLAYMAKKAAGGS